MIARVVFAVIGCLLWTLFFYCCYKRKFSRRLIYKIIALIYSLALIGGVLNCICLFTNGGEMPVLLKHGEFIRLNGWHCVLTESTKFAFLADRFTLSFSFMDQWEFVAIYSIGDVLISLSLLLIFIILVYSVLWSLLRRCIKKYKKLAKKFDMPEKPRRKMLGFLGTVENFAQKYRLYNLDKLQKKCSHDLIIEFITSKDFELSERFCMQCFLEENSLIYQHTSNHQRLNKRPAIVIINSEQNPRSQRSIFNAVKNLVKSMSVDQNNIKEVLDKISNILKN
jgi:hypothetical protein